MLARYFSLISLESFDHLQWCVQWDWLISSPSIAKVSGYQLEPLVVSQYSTTVHVLGFILNYKSPILSSISSLLLASFTLTWQQLCYILSPVPILYYSFCLFSSIHSFLPGPSTFLALLLSLPRICTHPLCTHSKVCLCPYSLLLALVAPAPLFGFFTSWFPPLNLVLPRSLLLFFASSMSPALLSYSSSFTITYPCQLSISSVLTIPSPTNSLTSPLFW